MLRLLKLLRDELSPLKMICLNSHPCTSTCDLSWKEHHRRRNELRWVVLEPSGPLLQYNWRTQQEDAHVKTETEEECHALVAADRAVMWLWVECHPALRVTPELRERHASVSCRAFKSARNCWTLAASSQSLQLWDTICCHFKPPSLLHFVTVAQGKLWKGS